MAEEYARKIGTRSDVGEALGGGEEVIQPEPLGSGPLFDPNQGGLPSVMATGQPQVEPLMPGGMQGSGGAEVVG